MADETLVQRDENNQNAEAGASSANAQTPTGTPPAGENPASGNGSENRVPQSRFNEVVHEKNRERELREMYEARIRELESRQSVQVPQRPSVIDAQAERLAKELSMDKDAARKILEANAAVREAEMMEIEHRQKASRAEEWARNKAQVDPDFKALGPELDREFSAKSPQMQQRIASDPELLEMFYESVRSKNLGSKAKEAYAKGADEAYRAKQVKQAVSNVPGSSSGSGSASLSRELLRRMSPEEYMKRQPEINEALRLGKL